MQQIRFCVDGNCNRNCKWTRADAVLKMNTIRITDTGTQRTSTEDDEHGGRPQRTTRGPAQRTSANRKKTGQDLFLVGFLQGNVKKPCVAFPRIPSLIRLTSYLLHMNILNILYNANRGSPDCLECSVFLASGLSKRHQPNKNKQ